MGETEAGASGRRQGDVKSFIAVLRKGVNARHAEHEAKLRKYAPQVS